MASDFRELASVDGTITPTADAMVPLQGRRALPRRRRLRGDPPLRRPPVRARRPPRPARALGRGDRARVRPRRAGGARSTALLAEHGDGDGQLRLIVTRGGRRIAATEPIPPHAESLQRRDRHLLAERHPQRGQVALLRGQHAGDPDRQRPRAPTRPSSSARRHRARAADLLDLLGLARRATCAPRRSTPACSSRSPATAWSRRSTSRRAPGRSPTCAPRGEAFLASTTREIQAVSAIDGAELPDGARPAHPRGPAGLRARPSAGSFDDLNERTEKAGVRWTSS